MQIRFKTCKCCHFLIPFKCLGKLINEICFDSYARRIDAITIMIIQLVLIAEYSIPFYLGLNPNI